MQKKIMVPLALVAAMSSMSSQAETVTVTIDNLTQGLHFTPLLVAAHSESVDVFEVGTTASANLRAMAEGGSIEALSGELTSSGATVMSNPANGMLAPGLSATATLMNVDLTTLSRLSVVAMLLPTNDGFMGADAITLESGTHTYNINAYDAGTEYNNELLVEGAGGPGQIGIPGDPSGAAGTGGTGVEASETNTMVHIHPGVLGDFENTGGRSDLDSRVHRWLNPVARVTVTVAP